MSTHPKSTAELDTGTAVGVDGATGGTGAAEVEVTWMSSTRTSRVPVAEPDRAHFSCRTPGAVTAESVELISHAGGSAVASVHTLAVNALPCTRNRSHCLAVVTALIPDTIASLVVVPSWASADDKIDPAKMKKTDSGLRYQDLKEGTGETPQTGQSCEMHYTGWLWEDEKKGKK